MPRSIPVWGFPTSYNPNLMGDHCDTCGASIWLERKPIPHPKGTYDGSGWICAKCILPKEIPLE